MKMGLPGFEPGSIAPEATSLDQTSRQPLYYAFRRYLHFITYRNKYSSAAEQVRLRRLLHAAVQSIYRGAIEKKSHVRAANLYGFGSCGFGATFPWYILAAMHSVAATTASQKDHWNPADRRTVRVMPSMNGIGNVLVVEPIKGMLRFITAWQIIVVATKPMMKNSTVYSGFL